MARRARSKSRPTDADTLIDGIFRRCNLDQKARDYRAMAAWHAIAEGRLGHHTRPERVRGNQLIVRVANAAWANELGFLLTQLRERLQATPGAEWIEDLRFTIGPLDELPSWADP